MGNTSIMCSVHGPAEGRRGDGGPAGSGHAVVEVDVNVAGFAGVDRKRRAGGSDRYAPSALSHLVLPQSENYKSNRPNTDLANANIPGLQTIIANRYNPPLSFPVSPPHLPLSPQHNQHPCLCSLCRWLIARRGD
jgi:hypothetical protein